MGDQRLFRRQLQLEIVLQELGQALPDLLCLGFRPGEPEKVVICVSAVAQTPVGGITGIPGGQAAKPPPQPARPGAVTALACLRERILHLRVLPVMPAEFPSGVFRYENCLDELVQPVQVNIGQDRGYHAPNAIDNFCFDVTLSYRRLELPRRGTGKL